MPEQNSGAQGIRKVVEGFADQEMVRHNRALAQRLAEIAEVNEYEEKQELYVQGETGRSVMYFILSGSFDMIVNGKYLRILNAGQSVGEFPIIDPSVMRYTVTIRAREHSVVASVSETQFLSIADDYPEIWKNLAKMLVRRLIVTIPAQKSPCVFVGHGRSKLWARVQVFLQHEFHLSVVTYESEARVGDAIVPVLEKMLNQATFAVLILTGEDDTIEAGKRARQNVVHEAGLFQGVLGFKRAIMLVQKGLEEFSNVAGLQVIYFEGDNIENTFYELERALRREGLVA